MAPGDCPKFGSAQAVSSVIPNKPKQILKLRTFILMAFGVLRFCHYGQRQSTLSIAKTESASIFRIYVQLHADNMVLFAILDAVMGQRSSGGHEGGCPSG